MPTEGPAGDDGSPDPGLSAAVAAHAADPGRLPDVVAALHHARVLAPVVALAQETGTSPTGLRVDKTSDIALPLLLDPDGHRAVLVFSCLDTLHRWDRSARPVPVPGPRAAAVALAEGAEGVVLDVSGPCPVTLGHPEVRALADGRALVPAYDDEELAAEVALVLAGEPAVLGGWIAPGPGVDAVLTVVLDPVLAGSALQEAGARLARGLSGPAAGPGSVRGVDLVVQVGESPPPRGRPVFIRSLS